jgi:outer membrane protein assembly factor BamB
VDEHHVYFTWSDNAHFQLAALKHDGKEVWRRDLGALENRHGGGISPIVFEDMVIIQKDLRGPSAIYAINRMTGKTIWKVDRRWDDKNQTTFATPLVYQPESGEPYLIFNSISSGMTAVNPKNGQTLWELPDVFPQRPIMSPIQVGELIFSSCGAGNVADSLVAIRPPQMTGDKPEVAYSIRKSAPYVPTPVAKGSHLFMVSDGGIATCIDAPTGKEIWKEKLGDTYFSSPICVDDRIYVVSRRADVVVFRAADKFELLGRTLINQATNATPIIDNGRMYLRTESHLYCLSGG